MKSLDKNYLSLQFKNYIHSKDATEFQSFFENIMEKAFLDFRRIRPYGNEGDGGNDGYRKDLGIYYQVYAPRVPKISEKDAVEKLQNDFQKLKIEWDEISNIKEYNFVFNDKYDGSVQFLEKAITELKEDNPKIEFRLFLARDLENVFFSLRESDILDIGFNIDLRQAVENAYSYLEHVKNELERENAGFAQKILENTQGIISDLNDENLSLEYEILECRCLQKFEKIDEAKEKYESISKRFPNDPRPLLHLAEIYLNDNRFDKNGELLEKAQKIDEGYWLLKLEQMLRKSHLREHIERTDIDDTAFPDDANIKASFYRVYGLILEDLGDQQSADSFIERAIHLNADRFSNYVAKLALIEVRLLSSQDDLQRQQLSQELLEEMEKVENKFLKDGDVGARNRAILNSKKIIAFLAQENISSFENLAKETFELLLMCYFDKQVERIFVRTLQYVLLPVNDLNRLLDYLKNSVNEMSDNLAKTLIVQFNLWGNLLIDGKRFFEEIKSRQYLEFINDLENKEYEKLLVFLNQDIRFSISFANTLKNNLDLRKKIIENLPDDENIQKKKLQLLLNFDEKDYDEAFQILKQLDLSQLSYVECGPMLHIAQQKLAWDFEIIILEKLLAKEKNERLEPLISEKLLERMRDKKDAFNLRIQLFNAYLHSKKFLDAIDIGEQLLQEDVVENFYNPRKQDVLLSNTLYACLERGKVDNKVFGRAESILDAYQLANPSFEFKAGVVAELYLNNNQVENALQAVIDGVKIKKLLSPQEYARLYFLFVRIGNQITELNTESLDKVQEGNFVKLRDKDRWYFIGDRHELDAFLISKTHSKYSLFIDKELEDKIVFENESGSEIFESAIQLIFNIEKYILWQVVQNFQRLAKEGDLEGVQMIKIPQKEDAIDIQNLLKFFEDLNASAVPLFEIYCKNNVPLAMLAVGEGGLTGAIGRIQNENNGFVHFSVGTLDELERQKEIAKRVVEDGVEFYIDGTSALVLSEIGMLQKIHKYVPNLKVPQSVISFLAEINNRFRYMPGQTGDTIGYSRGKITISSIEQNKRELLQANFIAAIKLLESNSKKVAVISSANKVSCFSETRVPDELSDACILAQKEGLPVLTEDFLYLKMNETETGKKIPDYFSSWSLVRIVYEKGFITFDEYLEFFSYLSSYRFRFLSLNSEDIEKAVFGDGEEQLARPEYIRRLNFSLTLSEEYGVSFQDALRVVGIFFFRVMMDNTVALDVTEKIFVEIIESFPAKTSKMEFGERLLGACITIFEGKTSKFLSRLEDKLRYQKIDKLLQAFKAFNVEPNLVVSN